MTDKDNYIQEKLVGYHDKPSSYWQRLPYRSDTGGVSPMFLEGLEKYTNHRIHGMTPDRRAWRKQWKLDQELSHREPVYVHDLYVELNNPIRRFYKYPMNKFQEFSARFIGKETAVKLRRNIAIYLWTIFGAYAVTYYFMFHTRDWTQKGGVLVQCSKPVVQPGMPGYPFVSNKKLNTFYDLGFSESVLFKSEEQIRAEYAKELAKKST